LKALIAFLAEPNQSPPGIAYELTGKFAEAWSQYLKSIGLGVEWEFEPVFYYTRQFDWGGWLTTWSLFGYTEAKHFEKGLIAMLGHYDKFLYHLIVFSEKDFGGRILDRVSLTHGKLETNPTRFKWLTLFPASHEASHVVLNYFKGPEYSAKLDLHYGESEEIRLEEEAFWVQNLGWLKSE